MLFFRFCEIYWEYRTAGHLVFWKPWTVTGHIATAKKYILGSHTRVLWSSFPLHWKPNILLVNYDSWWQHQMSVSRTQAWQAKWAVFKIPGFVCKRFLSFFPTPSQLFCWRHFSCGSPVLDSRSSFFAPKPHGNACYAGYMSLCDKIKCRGQDQVSCPFFLISR